MGSIHASRLALGALAPRGEREGNESKPLEFNCDFFRIVKRANAGLLASKILQQPANVVVIAGCNKNHPIALYAKR
jgi:hypothetical protein